MKIIYEAKDGTQFETKEECAQYEFKMEYVDILFFCANDEIRVWNKRHEKMFLSDFLEKGDLESFFDNAFYVDFKTEKARVALKEFATKHNIIFDLSYEDFPFESTDFYYWDEQNDCWNSFSTLKGFVASLEEIRNSPSN